MMDEDQIDSLYINFVTPFFVDTESIAKEIAEVNRQKKKPIICNLMTDKRQWTGTLNILRDGGVPSYSFPSTAARALASLVRYAGLQSAKEGKIRQFGDVDRNAAEKVIKAAREKGKIYLSAGDVYAILSAYKIPAAPWKMAGNPAEAADAAKEIGFPVVVKADSETLVHKTDSGGVALGLKDAGAVKSCVEDMRKRLNAKDLCFLVQKYLPGGSEIIVGAKAEGGLGHLIMFGLGGIFVEVLKDVVFKITPITTAESEEMLSAIKGAPLLKGIRGKESLYEAGIKEIICRISQLVTDIPAIQEMDLNPVIAFSDRVFVADARISI
jgi:acetyltransferase